MAQRMTISEYNRGILKAGGSNKYGNKIVHYKGQRFHSAKEAQYAMQLDLLRSAQNEALRVVEVESQVPYRFEVNGVKVGKYVLDFKVTYGDGRVEYIDVKGYTKGTAYSVFKMKKALMLGCFGITVIEV